MRGWPLNLVASVAAILLICDVAVWVDSLTDSDLPAMLYLQPNKRNEVRVCDGCIYWLVAQEESSRSIDDFSFTWVPRFDMGRFLTDYVNTPASGRAIGGFGEKWGKYAASSFSFHLLMLPCWALIPPLFVPCVLWWMRFRQQRLRMAKGQCPSCGYQIRESRKRCAECGWVMPYALALSIAIRSSVRREQRQLSTKMRENSVARVRSEV